MASLEHSVEAKNVTNKFYQVDKMIYVEGQDDIIFWDIILKEFAQFTFKIEKAGGKEELEKYIEEIKSGVASYFVARDSDYDEILGFDEVKGVIRTYGHSIENTIGTSAKLSSVRIDILFFSI